jgi:hypothetical protein
MIISECCRQDNLDSLKQICAICKGIEKKHFQKAFGQKSKRICLFLIKSIEDDQMSLPLHLSYDWIFQHAYKNNWADLTRRIYRLAKGQILNFDFARGFRKAVEQNSVEMTEFLAGFPEIKVEYKNWALKYAYRNKLWMLFETLRAMPEVKVKKYMR